MKHENRDIYIARLVGLILISFLMTVPFLLVGPPVPLYSIQNGDSINHTISIEIIILNKIPIHKNEYHLTPMEEVFKDKSMLSLLYLPLIGDKCTIKTTIDSNPHEIREVTFGIWEMPHLSIINSTINIAYSVV